MVSPKPVKLTQVDAASYDGAFEPEPLIIVGPIPGGGGGGGGGAVDSVNGKTGAVVLSAGDVGARASGNVPWADVSGKPTTFAPTIGTTATTAVAGNDARLAKADTAVQPAGLTKAAVGLGSVDNTSDANKPVSTAQAVAIAAVAASVTALDIESVSRNVMVVTGDEPRPAGAYCIWNDLREGEVSEPTNMLATDSWFRPRVGPTPVAPTITTTALGAMTQGSSTSQQLAATGSTPITWAVTAGTLPAGLTLSTGGLLAGTPSAAGAYSFTVTATNAAGSDPQAYSGTIAATGASVFSVFGAASPGTGAINTDGGGSLWVGNRFYTSKAAGINVRGVRIWEPASSDSTFLNLDVVARLFKNDWAGSIIGGAATFASAVLATKTHTALRVAGTWTDILFDTPVALPKIAAGAGATDLLTLAVQYAGGNHYVTVTSSVLSTEDSIDSAASTGTYLAEQASIGRGVNSIASGAPATYYGIDVLFEVA